MKDIHELCLQQKTTCETGYAKINLALDVTGKLENGYHLVKMIMETISLRDELSFSCSTKAGIRMTCSRGDLSCGEDNLVIRAAKAIFAEAGIDYVAEGYGLDIRLEKNIPMAAGMAGGSTDAAAVLRAINRLFELGFSTEKLCEIGVGLGADIPYCIRGGSYLSEGIGEVLTPIANPPKTYLVIIKPSIDVSTKYVYEHLDTDGVEEHPDVDGMIKAMECNDIEGMCKRLGNVLRDVSVVKYPIIREIENYLCSKGACGALMSGSGPTVFGIFDDEERCDAAVRDAQETYSNMFVAKAGFIV